MREEDKKHIKISFRVSEAELEKIDNRVDQIGMTRSALARKLFLERKIVIYDFSELDALSGEIGRIGNNINQIARKLNQGGKLNQENAVFLKTSLEVIQNSLGAIYSDITGCKSEERREEDG